MTLSRRSFVTTAGLGGTSLLLSRLAAARGREDLVGSGQIAGAGPTVAPTAAASRLIRLGSNENPNGPGPRALEALNGMLGEASRYPYQTSSDLLAALARHLGLREENLLLGCGSGEILRVAVVACCGPDRPLVTAGPTFESPGRVAQQLGFPVRTVRVDANLKLDLPGMLAQATGAGLIFLCNPNNPTPTVHTATAVSDFIRDVHKVSPETVILVDEAYHEYVEDPGYRSMIPLAVEDPRVVVSRTFSKVYGMAGLRVGYAVGRPERIGRLRTHILPNNVNVLASAAAIASLADSAHVAREVAANREAREETRRALERIGYPSPASHTNFILVDIRRDARSFQQECRANGVVIGRVFPPLVTHARITIGTVDEMRQAVAVFTRLLGTASSNLAGSPGAARG